MTAELFKRERILPDYAEALSMMGPIRLSKAEIDLLQAAKTAPTNAESRRAIIFARGARPLPDEKSKDEDNEWKREIGRLISAPSSSAPSAPVEVARDRCTDVFTRLPHSFLRRTKCGLEYRVHVPCPSVPMAPLPKRPES